ncbi:MarR family EPS-associated transcriptional regulator [Antarctobacter heliothermus]|uniref:EPS-associated transcriptional regulator, MarR family n=1 Tax=Antarctobacter heliothermus TaxID=74033 RepID=A0A239D8N8_9RHOB|nr:MarR family EPS-associated transcriptional regulator [Antarctobacter heliothermus]SNS28735.1 EPS-associated transcriptional regulator, MarR family [Antarctobacter heliothermus]
MVTKQDKFREEVRFRLLRLLNENPEMSQRELARAVGVSNGGVHYVINALVSKGLLKLSNFTAAEDKRRCAYLLTPKGVEEKARLTRRFVLRKMAEYEALQAEIEEIKADLSDEDNRAIRSLIGK